MKPQKLHEFTEYMNAFYGTKGIYPSTRNLTPLEVAGAVITMLNGTGFTFEGDCFDRERCRDILFSEEEQTIMYQTKAVANQ